MDFKEKKRWSDKTQKLHKNCIYIEICIFDWFVSKILLVNAVLAICTNISVVVASIFYLASIVVYCVNTFKVLMKTNAVNIVVYKTVRVACNKLACLWGLWFQWGFDWKKSIRFLPLPSNYQPVSWKNFLVKL